jgi:Tfp pilus assembly protein PilF
VTRIYICFAALCAFSGCANGPDPVSEATPPQTPAEQAVSAEAQTLATMLERARAARLSGRLAEAESSLEAALRIAPGDARLWLELAEVQFASGEFDSARTLAERAVSLSGGDLAIIEAAQRLSSQMGN